LRHEIAVSRTASQGRKEGQVGRTAAQKPKGAKQAKPAGVREGSKAAKVLNI
jgi:hypothetical protein